MSAYDVSGTVLSVIGLAGVAQQGYSWAYKFLPIRQLQDFDEVMTETSELYVQVMEEGLLRGPGVAKRIEFKLVDLRREAEILRGRTHIARGIRKQFKAYRSGLSKKIKNLRLDLEGVRSEISTTSDRERRELRKAGLLKTPTIIPPEYYQEMQARKEAAAAAAAQAEGSNEGTEGEVVQASAVASTQGSLQARIASTVVPSAGTSGTVHTPIAGPSQEPSKSRGCPGTSECPTYDPKTGLCSHQKFRSATAQIDKTAKELPSFDDVGVSHLHRAVPENAPLGEVFTAPLKASAVVNRLADPMSTKGSSRQVNPMAASRKEA